MVVMQDRHQHDDESNHTSFAYDLSKEEADDEARLFQHNRRFQTTILEHLDHTIEKAEEDIGILSALALKIYFDVIIAPEIIFFITNYF